MNNLEIMENNEMFDLGSAPVSEDFDPFAFDEELDETFGETDAQQLQKEGLMQEGNDPAAGYTEMKNTAGNLPAGTAPASAAVLAAGRQKASGTPLPANAPEKPDVPGTKGAGAKKMKTSEPGQGFEEKLPVFAYAGALENISDISMTFEELRIEKAVDFPELEDGKRVSWTVEYGKITKTVSDPFRRLMTMMKRQPGSIRCSGSWTRLSLRSGRGFQMAENSWILIRPVYLNSRMLRFRMRGQKAWTQTQKTG